MRILVIEDEPTSMKLVNLVLSLDGHKITEAVSAEAAISAVIDKQPDIILLDLNLPGIDGLTLAAGLKNSKHTCHIPIVAVTAYPDRFSREKAMAAHCDAYIVKPINTRTISEQISQVGSQIEFESPTKERATPVGA